MNKIMMLGTAFCAVVVMASCSSKESAYKKAYEKAKAEQAANVVTTPTTTTPTTVTTTPTTTVAPVAATTVVTPVQDYSNVAVRTEEFSMVSGQPLQDYSVVVGSFSVKANAEKLASQLAGKGYSPRVIQANPANKGIMYRVVATTSKSKSEAAQARAGLLGSYPDAWLLYQK